MGCANCNCQTVDLGALNVLNGLVGHREGIVAVVLVVVTHTNVTKLTLYLDASGVCNSRKFADFGNVILEWTLGAVYHDCPETSVDAPH